MLYIYSQKNHRFKLNKKNWKKLANRLVDDRCWNCKFPLTGVLDPCDHGKRCRVNEERVECGFVYGRVKCELGGNCDARFEEHFFDYIH